MKRWSRGARIGWAIRGAIVETVILGVAAFALWALLRFLTVPQFDVNCVVEQAASVHRAFPCSRLDRWLGI